MDKRKLGIDIGGVIRPGPAHFLSGGYLDVPPLMGAFEAITTLVEVFGGETFLVSSCTPEMETRTLDWFRHLRFFEQTGVRRDYVRFCRRRSEKAPICRELEITDFVDDRIEVLRSLTTVSRLYLFNPDSDKPGNINHGLENLRVLKAWSDALQVMSAH